MSANQVQAFNAETRGFMMAPRSVESSRDGELWRRDCGFDVVW